MGFFQKIFAKKGTKEALIDARKIFFDSLNINEPTKAQELRATVYLCICGIAFLNHTDPRLSSFMDRLLEEAKDLSKDIFPIKIGELEDEPEKLEKIMSEFSSSFPETSKPTLTSITNGLAAFTVIYSTLGQETMREIISNDKGPFGIHGYATTVLVSRVFGKNSDLCGNSEITFALLDFHKKIVIN